MANDLLNELNRNLANAEEVGNAEWAAALKKRIAQVEKAPAAEVPTVVLEEGGIKSLGKTAAKKTAKKASKK